MNNCYGLLLLCFCLFSCGDSSNGQDSKAEETEKIVSNATQKKKTPANDREKADLKGAVKSVISVVSNKDSSIVVFDSIGRLIKEGEYYGVKGFSGKTYELDSLGNPLKLYGKGRAYDPNDNFSTYFYDKILNTYNAKGELITYETADTSDDSYKCHLKYNAKGQLIEEKYYDITDSYWYSLILYAYDDLGFLAEKKTYKMIYEMDSFLVDMTRYENDQYGNVVKEKFYSKNQKLAIKKYTLDAAGNSIQEIITKKELSFGEVEKIYHGKEPSKEDKELDKSLAELGVNPKPIVRKIIQTFDENNNLINRKVYKEDTLEEEIVYICSPYGDYIKITERFPLDKEEFTTEYKYDYDREGNWLRKWVKYEGGEFVLEAERIIAYYN